MAEPDRPRVALFARSWGRPHDEVAFVARSLAGALSRVAAVDVLVPGPVGSAQADGAFDRVAVGEPSTPSAAWPDPGATTWRPAAPYQAAVVDRPTGDLRALLEALLPGVPVLGLTASVPAAPLSEAGTEGLAAWLDVGMATDAGPPPGDRRHAVGLHVAVNPLAAVQRHGGLGFTGYLLVLGDRRRPRAPEPAVPQGAAWLAARFTRQVTVVIEDGAASVWRHRGRLGTVAVATRMDLLRLVSHAAVTVDLGPGPLVARECVESLRFGVPVVVPAGTAAHRLAAAGGGLWYRDAGELLGCAEALLDPATRSVLGAQGKDAADRWYGSPDRFVERVARALDAVR